MTEAQTKPEVSRHDPLMLMGFSAFQVWVTLCFFTPQLFPDRAADGNRVYELSLAVSVAALAVLAAHHVRMAEALRKPAVRWGLASCAALGTAIVPFCFGSDASGIALTAAAALLTGVATALFNVAWCQEYAEQGDVSDFALSVVVSSVIIYVLTNLAYTPSASPWVMVAISVSIPFFAAWALIRHAPRESVRIPLPIQIETPTRKGYTARLCVGVLIISFADEFMRNFYLNGTDLAFYSSQTNLLILVFKVVVSAMVVWAIERSRSEDFAFLYRASFLLALMAALLLPYAQSVGAMPYALTNCGAFLFKITVLLVALEFCVSTQAPPVLVFALVRGVWSLALLLGYGAFGVSAHVEPALLSAVGVLLCAVAYVFVFTPLFAKPREDTPADPTPVAPESQPAESSPRPTAEVCADLAQKGALSPREREVLLLLARGRATSRIEAELGISTNTANTHIKHVYAKLGVHSRQELLDLVEGMRAAR